MTFEHAGVKAPWNNLVELNNYSKFTSERIKLYGGMNSIDKSCENADYFMGFVIRASTVPSGGSVGDY